jgi:hypothetical protein
MAARALIQSRAMANWRQIQGRIRRARTSVDPAGKLNELFQKTRDAMVAFEAGAVEEKSGRNDEAIRWYTIAAQRFRRADWRQKAAEALTRLGAAVPEETLSATRGSAPAENSVENGDSESESAVMAEAQENFEAGSETGTASAEAREAAPEVHAANANAANASGGARHAGERHAGERPRRKRGRRGGRRHRRGGGRETGAKTGAGQANATHHHQQSHAKPSAAVSEEEAASAESAPVAEEVAQAASRFVSEPTGPFVERVTYIRAGDPALASRFGKLESLLRRLISAPLHRMDELDEAPAGPGVFLLSDSDLMTNYYIEACQTLRIGASQLARAGRAGRGARTEGKAALRSQLAEHLEISDTQATDYLRKHCVVRWLQLDEDAPHLAHFAIALLRPALNDE